MRTVLGLGSIAFGLFSGIRVWIWTRGDDGLLLGIWAWLVSVPLLLAALALIVAGVVLFRSTDLARGEVPIPMSRLGLRLGGTLVLCLCASAGAFLWPAHEVPDEEMSYSLQAGELVWLLPKSWLGEPGLGKGDIVLIEDPLDPSRMVLRRILAGPGQTVSYAMGELSLRPRVNRRVMNEGPQSREGLIGTWNVHSELLYGTPPSKLVEQGKLDVAVPGVGPDKLSFLTHDFNRTLRWRMGQGLEEESQGSSGPSTYRVTVPDGHWYLMADDRDVALDSRWWGPIDETEILGVVRLHRAVPDIWREEWQILRPVL